MDLAEICTRYLVGGGGYTHHTTTGHAAEPLLPRSCREDQEKMHALLAGYEQVWPPSMPLRSYAQVLAKPVFLNLWESDPWFHPKTWELEVGTGANRFRRK